MTIRLGSSWSNLLEFALWSFQIGSLCKTMALFQTVCIKWCWPKMNTVRSLKTCSAVCTTLYNNLSPACRQRGLKQSQKALNYPVCFDRSNTWQNKVEKMLNCQVATTSPQNNGAVIQMHCLWIFVKYNAALLVIFGLTYILVKRKVFKNPHVNVGEYK